MRWLPGDLETDLLDPHDQLHDLGLKIRVTRVLEWWHRVAASAPRPTSHRVDSEIVGRHARGRLLVASQVRAGRDGQEAADAALDRCNRVTRWMIGDPG